MVGLEGFKGVNDLVFGFKGEIYFIDQGQIGLQDVIGCVYCLLFDGQLICFINIIFSFNGIVYDLVLNYLLVVVMWVQQIWCILLYYNGVVGKVGVFVNLYGGMVGFDGLVLDVESCFYIVYIGFGFIWCLLKFVEFLLCICFMVGILIINLVFGGVDGKSFFIIEFQIGFILCVDVLVFGLFMYFYV